MIDVVEFRRLAEHIYAHGKTRTLLLSVAKGEGRSSLGWFCAHWEGTTFILSRPHDAVAALFSAVDGARNYLLDLFDELGRREGTWKVDYSAVDYAGDLRWASSGEGGQLIEALFARDAILSEVT